MQFCETPPPPEQSRTIRNAGLAIPTPRRQRSGKTEGVQKSMYESTLTRLVFTSGTDDKPLVPIGYETVSAVGKTPPTYKGGQMQ